MTATKVNDEINDEAIRKLFEEENLVFLATLMKDVLLTMSPHGWISKMERFLLTPCLVARNIRISLTISV
jgi:hypothetical protein